MKPIHAIILAAGKGTRMNSSKPKVLQKLADKPLLGHVLDQAFAVSEQVHVVYGFGGAQVQQAFDDHRIGWAQQAQQLGTGHAVMQAMPNVDENAMVLVLYGDVPLVKTTTLTQLIEAAQPSGVGLLSVILEDPSGYGRIVRNEQGQIQGIVEHKDADSKTLEICEANTGIMAVESKLLDQYLSNISTDNAQGELYLTDIIALAVADNRVVASVTTNNESEVAGVNDKQQLAALERVFQQDQAAEFMALGLLLKDPNRFDVRGSLSFGQDCEIDVNVVLEGEVILGDNVSIAPNCVIKNAKIGSNVTILENSVIDGAQIGAGASIGPFARLRPEAKIGADAKIGNFVEVKKSSIGTGSKVSHLSYIGDTTMGAGVNIGAGVITCNYDGVNKHQTVIEDQVFVGSDSQLVAPVTIGKNSTVGAGSTITKDTPENQLSLSRSKQISLKSWQPPRKK